MLPDPRGAGVARGEGRDAAPEERRRLVLARIDAAHAAGGPGAAARPLFIFCELLPSARTPTLIRSGKTIRSSRAGRRGTTVPVLVPGTPAHARWTSRGLHAMTAEAAAWPGASRSRRSGTTPPRRRPTRWRNSSRARSCHGSSRGSRRRCAAKTPPPTPSSSSATTRARRWSRSSPRAPRPRRRRGPRGSVVAVRRPATLRGAGDDACLVVDAPDLVVAVPPDAPPPGTRGGGPAGARRCRRFRTRTRSRSRPRRDARRRRRPRGAERRLARPSGSPSSAAAAPAHAPRRASTTDRARPVDASYGGDC